MSYIGKNTVVNTAQVWDGSKWVALNNVTFAPNGIGTFHFDSGIFVGATSGVRYSQGVCPAVEDTASLGENQTLTKTIAAPANTRGFVLLHVQVRLQNGSYHESQWRIGFSETSPVVVAPAVLAFAWESADGQPPEPVDEIDVAVYTVVALMDGTRGVGATVTSKSGGAAINVISVALMLEHWTPDPPSPP